jgi:hypothetical protein
MAALGAYQPDDDGWRWDIATGADALSLVICRRSGGFAPSGSLAGSAL